MTTGPRTAIRTRRTRLAWRALAWAYAAGLVAWLVLGLVPVAVRDIAVLRRTVTGWSLHHGLWASLAARVLHPDMSRPGMTDAALPDVALQYGFSLLNLTLGFVLLVRRPDRAMPRLLAYALLGTAATFNLPSHVAFHVLGSPWPIAVLHFTFHIVSGVTYLWAVVLFPSGRLPRLVALGPAGRAVAVTVLTTGVALLSWRGSFLAHPQFFVVFFGVAVPGVGITAQVLRLADRHTAPQERATSRLLIAALLPALAVAAVWCAARVLGAASVADDAQLWFPAVFAVVPVVLVMCIVRYRLWDLDRLLTRVLTYGLIVLAASAVYVVAVAVLTPLIGTGLLWTTVTLAAAAAILEPLRAWAAREANRVVFGQQLSPAQATRQLVQGLEQLTPTGEIDRITQIAVQATRADTAQLWVVDGDRTVLASQAGAPPPQRSPSEVAQSGASRTWPVQHAGRRQGHLEVHLAERAALTPVDDAVLTELAAQAGLLLENARLTVVLARQVDELLRRNTDLRAARRRLVSVQDAERRRMEQDLHDGAQQALVAAVIGVRAAGAAPSPADVQELVAVLDAARTSLAEILDGAPRILASAGLQAAIDQAADLARRSGLQVEVHFDAAPDEIDRDAAAAVFFTCVEALSNVAKYAAATSVRIVVTQRGRELRFAVTDNGVGLDPAADGGFDRLADRLRAVGGWLHVESDGHTGTSVQGGLTLDPVPLGANR